MLTEHDPASTDHVAEDVAQVALDDLDASPGVAEAIELYEASMKAYVTAAARYSHTTTVSSSSLLETL
jgi:hypothetical protein